MRGPIKRRKQIHVKEIELLSEHSPLQSKKKKNGMESPSREFTLSLNERLCSFDLGRQGKRINGDTEIL